MALTGSAAIEVVNLFGLSSAGSVSLPLPPRPWETEHSPTRFNTLEFSSSPTASLTISPYWFDLKTASPPGIGYAFSSPFLPKTLDANNPWSRLLLQLKKETAPTEWSKMETDHTAHRAHKISRCFMSEEKLSLCIEVHSGANGLPETGKPVEYGYGVTITARDTTLPSPPTPAQMVSGWRAAAEKGDVDAQFALCQKLTGTDDSGVSYPLDPAQAAVWCRKAAEQGHKWAARNLGGMYERGLGVAKSDAQAVVWYRQAAELGDMSAQYQLGEMYEKGQGVIKDDTQAMVWYRKAAEQKHQGAQHKLGEMYENGQGVAKDYAEAAAWFRKLVEQGNRSAQADLDRLRAKSQGISNK